MNLNIHFPLVVAVLALGFAVNVFNVVMASLSLLTTYSTRTNGSTLILAVGHVRRTLIRSVVQILVIGATPQLDPTVGWWLATVLTVDTIGDWHDRRVMRALL